MTKTIVMLCKTVDGKLEEVNELVFNNRTEIMIDNEKRRYTDDYFFINGPALELHGTLDRDTFSLLGRSVGVQTTTSAVVQQCPQFVFVKQRKGVKNKLMDTKTGEIYRS